MITDWSTPKQGETCSDYWTYDNNGEVTYKNSEYLYNHLFNTGKR